MNSIECSGRGIVMLVLPVTPRFQQSDNKNAIAPLNHCKIRYFKLCISFSLCIYLIYVVFNLLTSLITIFCEILFCLDLANLQQQLTTRHRPHACSAYRPLPQRPTAQRPSRATSVHCRSPTGLLPRDFCPESI